METDGNNQWVSHDWCLNKMTVMKVKAAKTLTLLGDGGKGGGGVGVGYKWWFSIVRTERPAEIKGDI